MPQTAKLFKNGRSQSVRLPAEFRFEGKEVFIRRDPETGDVVLSPKQKTWDRLLATIAEGEIPSDFLSPEQRAQDIEQLRDPFADWTE
jgi:antitoxin VapB